MRNKKAFWLAGALALAAAQAQALNTQAGTSGAQFLKLGAGARAGAMADSFSAIADDVSAAYYNPAGLSQLPGAQLGGAHTAYFQGISYEVLQFAYPFSREAEYSRHTLAFGAYYLAIGDIDRRVSDTTEAIGQFGASDGAYAASYAYGVSRKLSVGVTGKYISQVLDSYHASAFAGDIGLLYRPSPAAAMPLSLSAVVKNVGTRPGFAGGQTDPLPMSETVGLGVAPLRGLKLNIEGAKYRDSNLFAALGGELSHSFADGISAALRFGYSSRHQDREGLNGFSLGGGLNWNKASFDLAWIPFGQLGDTFRYSLRIRF